MHLQILLAFTAIWFVQKTALGIVLGYSLPSAENYYNWTENLQYVVGEYLRTVYFIERSPAQGLHSSTTLVIVRENSHNWTESL